MIGRLALLASPLALAPCAGIAPAPPLPPADASHYV